MVHEIRLWIRLRTGLMNQICRFRDSSVPAVAVPLLDSTYTLRTYRETADGAYNFSVFI